MMRRLICLSLAAFCACCGCLPATKVVKNPGQHDHGVRFYRPKPYLLVRPMTDSSGRPVEGYVTLETVMLPDFSEEYSIHVHAGFGTNETEIALTDGWRLDGLNVDVDAQSDENLEALADVVKLVPTLTARPEGQSSFPVRASNVPLGYYESVVSEGRDCKKRLYGFRYVGFLPYSPCPVEYCGLEHQSCYQSETYALLFQDGVMVFRPLHQINAANAAVVEPAAASAGRDQPSLSDLRSGEA